MSKFNHPDLEFRNTDVPTSFEYVEADNPEQAVRKISGNYPSITFALVSIERE